MAGLSSRGLLDSLFGPVYAILLAVNTAGVVEVLLYGIHVVLFFTSMFILINNRRPSQWFIGLTAILMFLLSTADVSITIRLLTHDITLVLLDANKLKATLALINVKNPLFVTNNFIADMLMLYRCYMVWGRSRYVLIGASLLVLVDTICGYLAMGGYIPLGEGAPQNKVLALYIWSIFAINLVMTGVTIGRIVWMTKAAEQFTGQKYFQGYRVAMAVLLQSSFVYTACILAFVLFPNSPYKMVLIVVCMRVVAIMPTLLIVQVGLGRVITESNRGGTLSQYGDRTTSIVLDTIASV